MCPLHYITVHPTLELSAFVYLGQEAVGAKAPYAFPPFLNSVSIESKKNNLHSLPF